MLGKLLITGGTGFIGSALVSKLFEREGVSIVATTRAVKPLEDNAGKSVAYVRVASIDSQTVWSDLLIGVETIIHTAGCAHISLKSAHDLTEVLGEVNTRGTLNLARQAAAAGVKRFIFLSSIGVNGNQSSEAFSENSPAYPHDAYAVSKFEAEKGLLSLATHSGMEIVIIRPPLVYGPGAPGNFDNLVRWIKRGVPLPLGAVNNKRSLVALENLVSLILLCADREQSPRAANQVFMVADGEDVSTSTLLRKVAHSAGRSCLLLPVPIWMLRAGARLLGKQIMAERLLGNLQVDASKARTLLAWRPVVSMEEQLDKMFKQGN